MRPFEWCRLSKNQPQAAAKTVGKSSNDDGRFVPIRDLNAVRSGPRPYRKYATKIQHIADALIAEGCLTLDAQAKALGVRRSTAWTIMKTKHKLDRLSFKTTSCMLASPVLPPSVRTIVSSDD